VTKPISAAARATALASGERRRQLDAGRDAADDGHEHAQPAHRHVEEEDLEGGAHLPLDRGLEEHAVHAVDEQRHGGEEAEVGQDLAHGGPRGSAPWVTGWLLGQVGSGADQHRLEQERGEGERG
jgi:hypothetical protein